jgi:hypothetical protein
MPDRTAAFDAAAPEQEYQPRTVSGMGDPAPRIRAGQDENQAGNTPVDK